MYQKQHPKATKQAIADYFAVVWGTDIKRRTIGDFIQQKDRWLEQEAFIKPACKRQKTGQT